MPQSVPFILRRRPFLVRLVRGYRVWALYLPWWKAAAWAWKCARG